MKSNKNRFSKIIGLIVGLTIFAIHSVSAQDFNEDYTGQLPVKVDVILQPTSPLQIKVLSVDNTNKAFQLVNYTYQNVDSKPIRAYVVLRGGTTTSMTTENLFEPYQLISEKWREARINISRNETISMSVDYVLFTDGSSWGEDKNEMSKQIKQCYIAMKIALDHLAKAMESGGRADLMKILDQDSMSIQIPMPEQKMDQKSTRGFELGYKTMIRLFQREKHQDDAFILKKLEELRTQLEDSK